MSISNLANPALRAGGNLLRGTSLRGMARGVGVFAGAGLMAAIYQITSDETRATINSYRIRGQYKRQRHELILAATLGSALPAEIQNKLLHSRDSWKTVMKLLVDPTLAPDNAALLRQVIHQTCNPTA